MSHQVSEFRSFNYLTILKTPFERIYRLLYPDDVKYFKTNISGEMFLLESTGELISGDLLEPLYKKIQAYERIFSDSLEFENLDNFLRIDEVRFLLDELEMNQPDLENQLYNRLFPHVQDQIMKRFYKPLILPRILVQNDFVYNYLLTNIGHPDESENYFNRMKIMIQQLSEHTQYVEIKNYFKVLRSLLHYVKNLKIETQNVVFKSLNSACVLISGFETFKNGDHLLLYQNFCDNEGEAYIIELNNAVITNLIAIFNSLPDL